MRRIKLIGFIVSAFSLATVPVATNEVMLVDKTAPVKAKVVTAVPATTMAIAPPPLKTTKICIMTHTLGDWPIEPATQMWNENGRNFLEANPNKLTGCTGQVYVEESDTGEYWGLTQFYTFGGIKITFSTTVPPAYRLHVVCHELGHVLGLPHSDAESCTNINKLVDVPAAGEVQTAGQDTWEFWTAARHSIGS